MTCIASYGMRGSRLRGMACHHMLLLPRRVTSRRKDIYAQVARLCIALKVLQGLTGLVGSVGFEQSDLCSIGTPPLAIPVDSNLI